MIKLFDKYFYIKRNQKILTNLLSIGCNAIYISALPHCGFLLKLYLV